MLRLLLPLIAVSVAQETAPVLVEEAPKDSTEEAVKETKEGEVKAEEALVLLDKVQEY